MNQSGNDAQPVTHEMALGRVVGLRHGDICEFRGIPYARPPVEALRWRMPEPALPWAGLRDATRHGHVCPQAPTPFDTLLGGALKTQSEDCLCLNIWTPGCDNAARPVMVWIHGGAFVIGAGSQSIYDGARLARRDVVVVTINYRLGVFGFLNLADASSGEAPGTGTEGLADQLLALDWVKRHIASFGGDPANVTVFGESAGAMSLSALLASPPAAGLFHKAILQSGSAFIGRDGEHTARVARAVLDALSLTPQEAHRAQDIPAAALVKAQIAVLAAAHDGEDAQKLGRMPFQPTVDGSLLPVRPIEAMRRGSAHAVPLLLGTTREEWKLFSAADPRLRLMSMASFETRLARIAGTELPNLLKAYSAGSPYERFNAVMTDRIFAVPATRMLAARMAKPAAYAYRFDWRSRLLGGIFGSCHAVELGFVFGTHAQGAASTFFGKGTAAEALANITMDCWVSFARSGTPETAGSGGWPCYDPDGRATMILGDGPPHIALGPERARIDAWNAVPDRRVGP
jgi:para-nitrobenzyl esterase